MEELLDRLTKFKRRSIDSEKVSREARCFDIGVTDDVIGQGKIIMFEELSATVSSENKPISRHDRVWDSCQSQPKSY